MNGGLKLRLRDCASRGDALDVLGTDLPPLLPGTSGALFLVSATGDRMNSVVEWPAAGDTGGSVSPAECRAFRLGRPQASKPDVETGPCLHTGTPGTAPTLCLPLVSQKDRIGVLHLSFDAATEPVLPGSDQGRFAARIVDDIALVLSNLELREALRRQSVTDPVTGLFTEAYLEATLKRELSRADRSGKPLSILLFHLDFHEETPTALFQLGVLFRVRFRAEDLTCRLGGGDFAVVLLDCAAENAVDRARRVLEILRELHALKEAPEAGPITACAGVAAYPDHGSNPEAVLAAVRDAVQAAKVRGGNAVELPPGKRSTSGRWSPVT
jgi:diguanylate cyclase (GGDEF)-like protein